MEWAPEALFCTERKGYGKQTKKYKHKKLHYTYPSGWIVKKISNAGAVSVLMYIYMYNNNI